MIQSNSQNTFNNTSGLERDGISQGIKPISVRKPIKIDSVRTYPENHEKRIQELKESEERAKNWIREIWLFREWESVLPSKKSVLGRVMKMYIACNGVIPYEHGYIYMIHAIGSDYFKIGKTIKPDQRLLRIAPQMPFKTRFAKTWHTNFMTIAEVWMHKHLAEYRSNGEWFELKRTEIRVYDELLGEILTSPKYSSSIFNAYHVEFWNYVLELPEIRKAEGKSYCDRLFIKARQGGNNPNTFRWHGFPTDSVSMLEAVFTRIRDSLEPVPQDLLDDDWSHFL